ncbi:hypothetical protein FOA52_007362 [Chlamydomonas sp. UWO 241]|nr:hypothetical protein FOA52_007362 [Chlamydomonas sp. UWO 241]
MRSSTSVLQLLALRGLLAGGVLVQALQKRHLVNYGINRAPTAKKRLAVPFRAAGTPSERSEYAQPDVAVVPTHLSYYHDGLSEGELLDALQKLLGMGASAQRSYYERWRKLSWSTIDAANRPVLDKVEKLDPSNAMQRALLLKYYSRNMATVEFWLSFCVLPIETQQYSQRLSASSWHIADNVPLVGLGGGSSSSSCGSGGVQPGASVGVLPDRMVVGFSGTNDKYRLLPLQVKQAHLPEPHLLRTNGRMLDVVLRVTRGNATLHVGGGDGEHKPLWQRLSNLAVELHVHALLDCGALLAGPSNQEVAIYLQSRLDSRTFLGPRGSSPVTEANTFLYDQARCRGTDLQLLPKACGLLTLGPGTCKEKCMQAAGRLRLLGRGQTLHLAASSEVTAKIQSCVCGRGQLQAGGEEEPSTQHVLQWVMHNTVQGLFFAVTKGQPERVPQDELMELGAMYGASSRMQPIADLVQAQARSALQGGSSRAPGPLASRMHVFVERIVLASQEHGEGYSTVASMVDRECEREAEREEEEEEEVERQLSKLAPAEETDWDYAAALFARSPGTMPSSTGIRQLAHGVIAKLHGAAAMQGVPWPGSLYATANFLRTVVGVEGVQVEYLRPVRALLLFPDGRGSAMLLPEREADALLELLWGAPRGISMSWAAVLVSLPFLRQAVEDGAPPRLAFTLCSPVGYSLRPQMVARPMLQQLPSVVALQLFDGDTRFRTEAQKRALHALIRRRLPAAEELTSMQGKQMLLPCSDLEAACEDVLFIA